MRSPFNVIPAAVPSARGDLETVQACGSNSPGDTTALARLQASYLGRTLALLPDTAAALALLVYGGACR